MRITHSLVAAGLAVLAVGATVGLASPAQAAPASAASTISFDIAGITFASGGQAGGHVTLTSDSGFQPGQPVIVTITDLTAPNSAAEIQAPNHTSTWGPSDTVTVAPGDTVSFNTKATVAFGTLYARATNLVVPSAGDSSFGFDLAATGPDDAAPSDAAHITVASDNLFQPGSTTTMSGAAISGPSSPEVSGDGGATYGPTTQTTSPVGSALRSISVRWNVGGPYYVGTLSSLTVTTFSAPAMILDTPIVNPVIGATALLGAIAALGAVALKRHRRLRNA